MSSSKITNHINPWLACAARVIDVPCVSVVCVCVCVCVRSFLLPHANRSKNIPTGSPQRRKKIISMVFAKTCFVQKLRIPKESVEGWQDIEKNLSSVVTVHLLTVLRSLYLCMPFCSSCTYPYY